MTEQEKLIFEIFKLEYEQAAQRYENIYKAIWQIFSYMAVLAAAILTFGARASNLPLAVAVLITLLPLLFWYSAIYIPMNFYGEQDRKRLADIEKNFNEEFLSNNINRYMNHYSGFYKEAEKPNKEVKKLWRVKQAVKWWFVAIITLIFVILVFNLELPVQVQRQDAQLRELKSELGVLSQKLDSIEFLLRTRNSATPNNNVGKPRQ